MAQEITDRTVLFIGGRVENFDNVAKSINKSDYIIAVDSGYQHCKEIGIIPNILIGDFDSVLAFSNNVPTLTLPTNKSYTDFYHALEYALDNNARELLVIGALGGRFDHTMGNVQASVYVSSRARISLYDGDTFVYILNSSVTNEFLIKNKKNHYLSVIAHSDTADNVNIKGALYPLINYRLSNTDPRAISNEFVGSDVLISCSSGILLIIVEKSDRA